MRRVALFSLLGLLLLPVAGRAGDEQAALQRDNQRLRAELELARKGQIYLVFDLEQSVVLFKASGVVVARLPISEVRMWGAVPAERVRVLKQKDARHAPEREKIKVTKADEAAPPPTPPPAPPADPAAAEKPKKFELQALELDDMPSDYSLTFDDGLFLTVAGVAENRSGSLERLKWKVSRALISDWFFFKGKSYTELSLSLPEREARLLYWTFNVDTTSLWRLPAPHE